jgi:hypothetical protein
MSARRVKVKGPVIETRGGNQVRLRMPLYPIDGSIDVEGKGTIRYRLIPNQWVSVPDEVFAALKAKFDVEREPVMVPDVEHHERNPHPYGTPPNLVPDTSASPYVLEFKES